MDWNISWEENKLFFSEGYAWCFAQLGEGSESLHAEDYKYWRMSLRVP